MPYHHIAIPCHHIVICTIPCHTISSHYWIPLPYYVLLSYHAIFWNTCYDMTYHSISTIPYLATLGHTTEYNGGLYYYRALIARYPSYNLHCQSQAEKHPAGCTVNTFAQNCVSEFSTSRSIPTCPRAIQTPWWQIAGEQNPLANKIEQ